MSLLLVNLVDGEQLENFVVNEKLWYIVQKVSDTYYPITRIWTTTQAVISIRHPNDLEILFPSHKVIEKGWIYKYLHPWLKTGLLTSGGEKWRQRRKILTPAFHFNILKKYMDITEEQGESLIRYLQTDGKESVQSLVPFCSRFTLNIICEAALGVALDKLDPKIMEDYKKAIYKLGSIAVYRIPRPYIHDWMLKLFPFLRISREQRQALGVLHNFTDKIVQERREYHNRTGGKYLEELNDEDDETVSDIYMRGKKRLAMLDLLLLSERNGLIDDAGIKEEVDTFTFEGHDTTAMAMMFILMLMAENQECQIAFKDILTPKTVDENDEDCAGNRVLSVSKCKVTKMTNILLLILFGVLLFHCFVRFGRRGRIAKKIHGPFSFPIIGNMLSFDISSPKKLWYIVQKVSDTYYPITRIWTTTQAVISIRHPNDLEILFPSHKVIEKGWIYKYLHPWLKTGLLTSGGEKWRQRRKILTPAFHFNILKKYMDITEEQGESLIRYLQTDGKESVQSLVPFCSRFTLNIICEAALGVALDKLDPKIMEDYKKAIYKLGSIAVYRIPRPYIHDWMLKLFPFLRISREQRQALGVLHNFTDKIVQERREYHNRTGGKYLEELNDEDDETVSDIYMRGKKRLAMLDLLLLSERNGLIDDAGIKEEVDTFTFEGHDTTAMAMMFILMLMAENQECQDKARMEVSEVADRNGGRLGFNQIQELHYLERCIKESLRLYPPVAIIFRYFSEDLQLKHALVPEDSHAMILIYGAHMDSNFWKDPNKFDPDRFLVENMQNRHAFSYVPFSAGPRNCIGQRFAMNELKSLIGRILYNFRLEPVTKLADMQLTADLILRPAEPVYVKFIQIEKKK
ncbi:cytochrome P450 4C1-like [Copidosoma floridanum]|uniref:cytochrome P450 4C1-like n=1 Tax=Copidosoma floridanum TaxID=29053 RepID=UPI000C6FB5F5|nr:cytochrome P450 4C1-like [Copidosoma floridanum]